jgi:hypothetical protein
LAAFAVAGDAVVFVAVGVVVVVGILDLLFVRLRVEPTSRRCDLKPRAA